MTNPNQRGNQMSDLSVEINKCSFDSQHGRPVNVGCSNLRYINNNQSNIQLRDTNGKNGQAKTAKLYFTVILRAIRHKENIGKND